MEGERKNMKRLAALLATLLLGCGTGGVTEHPRKEIWSHVLL
jgi:hypothetical protein